MKKKLQDIEIELSGGVTYTVKELLVEIAFAVSGEKDQDSFIAAWNKFWMLGK